MMMGVRVRVRTRTEDDGCNHISQGLLCIEDIFTTGEKRRLFARETCTCGHKTSQLDVSCYFSSFSEEPQSAMQTIAQTSVWMQTSMQSYCSDTLSGLT